jgi:hypothetical protein
LHARAVVAPVTWEGSIPGSHTQGVKLMSTEVLDWKAPVDGGELFAGAIALRFKLSKLGLSRKVASDSITTDADRELVRVGKDILESEAYDAIVKADHDMRAWVAARSIPCPVFESGAYLVKLTAYPMVSKGVREYRDVTRPALVELFIDDYQRARADGLKRLGSLASSRDYPEPYKVREAFSVKARWFELGAPGALKSVADGEFQAEADRMRAEFAEARAEGRRVIRAEMAAIVDRFVDRMTPGADGQKKRFTGTITANAQEFAELFSFRDMSDDRELGALVERMRGLLSGVDPEILRTDDRARAVVAEGFSRLKSEIEPLIKVAGRVYGDD